ncbi:MAG: excinuclease ABC subunit UvrC [Candidatus Bathyarchaeota archaeon]|nr:excinuclease ABC subunit UvrC [Candidatus Bathyarchaeota archaeon]
MVKVGTIESIINNLPEKTGVYIFKKENSILYVGKALNIKKRVRDHFQASKSNKREKMIIELVKGIDYIITQNETEALIEENILIKAHKPKFNIRLSDDKTYPYLKIDLSSSYPCLSITRRIKNDNSKYFGPYSDVGAMRNALKIVRKIFPIRICKKEIKPQKARPCLYHHINQCCAPCSGNISKKEYNDITHKLILFMEGKRNEVIQKLHSDMNEASKKLNYEKATVIRDQIKDIDKIIQEVKVVLPSYENLDAIAIAKDEERFCAQVIQVREGKLLSSESFDLKGSAHANEPEALESFLKQYYLKRAIIPEKLIINKRINDSQVISEWLSEKNGNKVIITRPLKRKMRGILDIAVDNAKIYLNQLKLKRENVTKTLKQLKKDLSLNIFPRRIECFDISTLGEKEAVGSKIIFIEGSPHKRGYRMYKIKTITYQDDQAMIGEIVKRRFRRLLKEKEEPPNLVLVDGGLGQVRAAKKVIDDLSIDIPIIGLAKKFEHVYFPDGKMLNLDRQSNSSLLLQQIRDEAHRFAIKYHRKRRDKI